MKTFSIAKSRRLRSTPYTSRIEKQGVTAYSSYNHMLLPTAFGSIEESYHYLKKSVQVWDVAIERQVEIIGNDSAKLVQLMTCRDLSKSKDENNVKIGELRSGCYSPHFGKVIGIAMMKKTFWEVSQTVKIEINNKTFDGKVCDLPFI